MKLKVCGMKYEDNIRQVLELKPDYMGFIFYPTSSRYVGDNFKFKTRNPKPETQFVGVFVNETIENVLQKVKDYNLDLVQLHGDEPVEYCRGLSKNIKIIKVFGVNEGFDFKAIEPYKPYVEYFMFDTATKEYGGSGKTFDWNKLKEYDNEIPFFLSGGISLENIDEVLALKNLNIHAIDVNSKFEISPGIKDIVKLKTLNTKMNRYETK